LEERASTSIWKTPSAGSGRKKLTLSAGICLAIATIPVNKSFLLLFLQKKKRFL
jgi:hypothetical protein